MNLVDMVVENIDMLKSVYFADTTEDIANYKINSIDENGIRKMYGNGNITALEDALVELGSFPVHSSNNFVVDKEKHRLASIELSRQVLNELNVTKRQQFDGKIVKLTGKPLSNDMKSILLTLSEGKDVSVAAIENTPEIKFAKTCVNNSISTLYLSNRDDMRDRIAQTMMKRGSYTIDSNSDEGYNGIVKRDSRLDIVIGLPASGKSSALTNSLSMIYNSKIIDNDEIKKEIPEYNNGWGSSVVHEESKLIEKDVLKMSFARGENIVMPKVGGDFRKMMNTIETAKRMGYKVNVHYVELDRTKALGRMITRFIDDGRFMEPKIIDRYDNTRSGNKINNVYELIKKSNIVDGYSKWNNGVAKGEKPIFVESNINGISNNINSTRKTNKAIKSFDEKQLFVKGEVLDVKEKSLNVEKKKPKKSKSR